MIYVFSHIFSHCDLKEDIFLHVQFHGVICLTLLLEKDTFGSFWGCTPEFVMFIYKYRLATSVLLYLYDQY